MIWPILTTLLLLSTFACKFDTSPYGAKVASIELNDEYLRVIAENEPGVSSTFKIAFIADPHNYYDELEELVREINARGPYAFVVVVGDVTNYGLLDEFKMTDSILSGLAFPYIVAIGNHDLLSNGGLIFSRLYGREQFVLSYKNVYMVVFNNNNWEMGGEYPDTAWVQTQLAMAPGGSQPILVSHISPDDAERFEPGEIAQWENLVNTYGVVYTMNGHNHNPYVKPFGGSTHIVVGAPSKRVFFELQVTPGGVSHQKISF